MKIKAALIATALAASFLVAPAFSEAIPKRGKHDARVTYATYQPGQVYKINTRLRNVTLVELDQGERISSVAVGDSESFKVEKLEGPNVFIIKPVIRGAATNLTVETNRRIYFMSVSESSKRLPNYSIKFTVPSSTKSAAKTKVTVPPATPYKYYLANKTGKTSFKPLKVWDDGQKTYFKFSRSAPIPAIFRADEFGREYTVNTVANGQIVTVTSRAERWVLRKDDKFICISGKDASS